MVDFGDADKVYEDFVSISWLCFFPYVGFCVTYCRVVSSTKCRGLREHMLLVFQQEAGRSLSGSLASGFLTGP